MVCCYCSPPKGGGVNPHSSENSSTRLNTEHIEVAVCEIDSFEENGGLHINAAQMEKLNMGALNISEGTEVKCLMQPGYIVITNLPPKLKTLDAIEELLYRQDELKCDFALPILQLINTV